MRACSLASANTFANHSRRQDCETALLALIRQLLELRGRNSAKSVSPGLPCCSALSVLTRRLWRRLGLREANLSGWRSENAAAAALTYCGGRMADTVAARTSAAAADLRSLGAVLRAGRQHRQTRNRSTLSRILAIPWQRRHRRRFKAARTANNVDMDVPQFPIQQRRRRRRRRDGKTKTLK